MKNIKYILSSLLAAVFFYGCDQGIDPISEVAPGADASAPVIVINAPTEGLKIKVNEVLASVTVDFEVTDDIEVASVKVAIDGNQIGSYNTFKDYRRFLVDDLVYDKLADGSHTLTITATDVEGKASTSTVNFEKEPAYIPKYPGEVLYMPFDGDYTDLISFKKGTVEGNPGFSEDNLNGTSSYSGAPDSYLTLPTDGLKNGEFSAIFWVKINAVPNRAGVLVMGPPMSEGGTRNDLTKGFRFFREDAAGKQRFKLNVGSGDTGTWFDGGEAADVDATTEEWVNLAFTISATEAKVYIDGQIVKEGDLDGVDWTDCNVLSIMSGAPNFTQWNHWSDESLMDELRIFNRALTQQDIQTIIQDDSGIFIPSYPPTFAGEMFYMPFDDTMKELFRDTEATSIGASGFAGESVKGSNAYAGAAESYLTLPTDDLTTLTTPGFSATFWYKANAEPGRGGILVIGPEDTEREEYPEVQNLRTSGFRFFREGDAMRQVFKLNVGRGDGDTWFDGGDAAALDPTTAGWVHMAFTISGSNAAVYFDGEVVAEGVLDGGVDWTGCDLLSIGSGAPRFTQWNHLADESFIDELRLFDKALTQEEIQEIRNADL